MTPPIGIDLQCRDADSNEFVGRYDTLTRVLGYYGARALMDYSTCSKERWFRKADNGYWQITKEPLDWAYGHGTSDQRISDEIRKAGA